MSEWKPGDVAMIPFTRGDAIALYTTDGWVAADNARLGRGYAGVRPLVVIDPESAEDVKDLWGALGDHGVDTSLSSVRDALREFAAPTPPRPDEPQGLGAVVEDTHGVKWVRAGESYTDPNWRRCGGDEWHQFTAIPAVRVLSEGVS